MAGYVTPGMVSAQLGTVVVLLSWVQVESWQCVSKQSSTWVIPAYLSAPLQSHRSKDGGLLDSIYILDIKHLSKVGLVKIFSWFVGYYFTLLTVSFPLQKLCNFFEVQFVNS